MFIFYLSIILVTAFFLIFGYFTQLDLQVQRQHDKLKGIVSSVAISIDGDEHQTMMEDHNEKDGIIKNEENITYNRIHEVLTKAVEANGLNSPIYTLIYAPEKELFEFGVTSDPNPYFRHDYTNFPKQLIDEMDVGGTIPLYESENGTWLSAFYPIKNDKNETVGLIEADIEFSEFIDQVRSAYLRQSLIALGVILLLAIILLPYTRKVLKEDEKQKRQLHLQTEIIQEKNRDITDSINYALKIQNTILPPLNNFGQLFNDSFVLFKPKDIVAGDFYFLETKGEDIYLAVADCTGHGVPGAMVSVICSNALHFAIHEKDLSDTASILDAVRDVLVDKFQASPDGIKDGMDISLCKFNLANNLLQYSGANNPLYIINNGEMETLKADKQPVGQFDHAVPFTAHQRTLVPGEVIYLFTDGFADQFGGEKGKKFKYKPFKDLLIKINEWEMDKQMHEIDSRFEVWKGEFEQVDDVCIIGIKV